MNSGSVKQCKIKTDVMENYFKNVFETENNNTRESCASTESHQNVFIKEEDIKI